MRVALKQAGVSVGANSKCLEFHLGSESKETCITTGYLCGLFQHEAELNTGANTLTLWPFPLKCVFEVPGRSGLWMTKDVLVS